MFNPIHKIKEKLLEVYRVKGEFSDLIVNCTITLKIKLTNANDKMNTNFGGAQHHGKIMFLLE